MRLIIVRSIFVVSTTQTVAYEILFIVRLFRLDYYRVFRFSKKKKIRTRSVFMYIM